MNAIATHDSTKDVETTETSTEWDATIIVTPMLIAVSILFTWLIASTSANHNPILLATMAALGGFCLKGMSQAQPFCYEKNLYVAGYAACASMSTSIVLALLQP